MYAYNIWITALTQQYEESIIAQLIKKGFSVKASDPNNSISCIKQGSPAALIALIIQSEEPQDTLTLWHIVAEVLEAIKGMYYSLVVTEKVACAWSVGNINLDQIKANPYKMVLN